MAEDGHARSDGVNCRAAARIGLEPADGFTRIMHKFTTFGMLLSLCQKWEFGDVPCSSTRLSWLCSYGTADMTC